MRHLFTYKHLVAFLVIIASATMLNGNDCNPCNGFERICCFFRALRPTFDCGSRNIQAHAGITPIVWMQRQNFKLVSCNIAANTCFGQNLGPLECFFKMPKFNELYKMPWTVGGKIGYSFDECYEVYVEGNYRQAKGKSCFQIRPNINTGTQIINTIFKFNNMSKYSFFDVYLGARTYFDLCWCDPLTAFFGIQIGLAHHKHVKADINFVSTSNTCGAPLNQTCVELFRKHTAFAGGANLGLEYCLRCGFSLVLTGEIIATCGPNGNPNVPVTELNVVPDISPSNFIVGGIGTEILFPVTLGVKYNF